MLRMFAVITAGWLFLPLAHAQSFNEPETAHFVPNELPSLFPPRITEELDIDGDLNEPGWFAAARAVNFSETFPGDQTEPPIGVTAMVTYSQTFLYVAFMVRDDPKAVRANLSDRDAIWQDDYVGLLLDPHGDGQAMYFIASNPVGIQGDTRIGSNFEDDGFNLLYESKGKITASGYQVEMAIPFKGLRFPDREVQEWRGTFWITHPRQSRSTYSWAAISRDNPCWSCQLGSISGLRGVKSGKNLEILPAIVGASVGELRDEGNPNSGFDTRRARIEPSLNLKYGRGSCINALLALSVSAIGAAIQGAFSGLKGKKTPM